MSANRVYSHVADLLDVVPDNPDDGDQYEFDAATGKMVLRASLRNHSQERNPHQTAAQDVGALATSDRGAINGVAALDATGRVPLGQLPETIAGPPGPPGPASLEVFSA